MGLVLQKPSTASEAGRPSAVEDWNAGLPLATEVPHVAERAGGGGVGGGGLGGLGGGGLGGGGLGGEGGGGLQRTGRGEGRACASQMCVHVGLSVASCT